MKQSRGLLAFCATLLVMAAGLVRLPLITAADRLQAFASGQDLASASLLELFQPAAGATRRGGHLGGLHLDRLLADRRSLEQVRALAGSPLPGSATWAFLALVSHGVTDGQGAFWPDLRELAANPPGQARERARLVLERLRRLARDAGSARRGLMAWLLGVPRARRLRREGAGFALAELADTWQPEAVGWQCRLGLLEAALAARWPTGRPTRTASQRGLELEAAAGQAVVNPLRGRVVARPGDCLLLDHGCGLQSLLCGLQEARPAGARRLAAGVRLGRAGSRPVSWAMWLGARRVSPWQLLPQP